MSTKQKSVSATQETLRNQNFSSALQSISATASVAAQTDIVSITSESLPFPTLNTTDILLSNDGWSDGITEKDKWLLGIGMPLLVVVIASLILFKGKGRY